MLITAMTEGTREGEKAPDFCLAEASEAKVCLYDELKKGPILLAFYPTDFGITCTLQFKRFNEMLGEFKEAGVRIVGVSVNSTRCHLSWKEKMGMDIPLLSDFDAAVAKRYGVMSPENSILKGHSGRATFLMDTDGTIRFRWVAGDSHVQPDYDILLAKARELRAARS